MKAQITEYVVCALLGMAAAAVVLGIAELIRWVV